MMKTIRLAALVLAVLVSAPRRAAAAQVLAGIDVLEEDGFRQLKGLRIGLITNQTGKNRAGRSTIEVLAHAPGVTLAALFMPEHGLQGTLEEGQASSGTVVLEDGRRLPLFNSLYGPQLARAPTPEILGDLKLDALVFDIQDIGARFYTYSASMAIAMEAAAKSGLRFVVLDRPNPISGAVVEGPLLDPEIRHITAYFTVPVRHGLTMGELARLHNLVAKAGVKLEVVPLKGWSRELWYDETGLPWTPPSPNMPDLDAAALYPGVGCFEATNVAVGRGTPVPFRWIGAPWFNSRKVFKRLKKANLAGVSFEREEFTPTKSVYQGKRSPGIRIKITDRDKIRPLEVFAHLVTAVRDAHPKDFEVRWPEIRRMVGTDRFKALYESKADARALIAYFNEGPPRFEQVRSAVLLY